MAIDRKTAMSAEEWRAFAGEWADAQRRLVDLYCRLLKSVRVAEAEPLRKALHRLQAARSRVESVASRQSGKDLMRAFYGDEWTYLA